MNGCSEHRVYRRQCHRCQGNARRRRQAAELIRQPWTEGDTGTDIRHCIAMLRDELVTYRRRIYGASDPPDWMVMILTTAIAHKA